MIFNYKIKRVFLGTVFLALTTYLGYSFVTNCKHEGNWSPRANLIIDQDGKPKACLLDLLKSTGIEHDETLGDIVKQTQANWIRKPGQERWDLASDQIPTELMEIFDKCGCIGDVGPVACEYDYVLVMGALASRMRTRLGYALELCKTIKCKKLVLLTGQRPRNVQLETEKDILGVGLDHDQLVKKSDFKWDGILPQTESGIMQLLYEQADVSADFKQQVQVVLVDAPMKLNAAGDLVRPTTGDTVDLWLAQNPTPGRCLVISNNPYIGYQDSVTRGLLPTSFKIETVGHQDGDDVKLAIYLDNMARWLYQEQQNRKQK